MPALVNLTNQRFNKLVAKECVGRSRTGKVLWKCSCDCGKEIVVFSTNLRGRKTKSCGECPNPNKVEHLPNGKSVITLERTNGETLPSVIDTADYPLVKMHRWCASNKTAVGKTVYVVTATIKNGRRASLRTHNLLLPNAPLVDHRNGDGLCNTRSNLRPATHLQNAFNRRKHSTHLTSKYRGVCWDKKSKAFRASISLNYKQLALGYFDSEVDAATAYNKAAKQHFGEFANLNDIAIEPVSQPALVSQPESNLMNVTF